MCLGSEPLTISWMHNKVEIPDSSGFAYSRRKNYCCLTVADAFPEDSGEYVCEVRNKAGSAQCFIKLVVSGLFFRCVLWIYPISHVNF